MAGRTSFTPAWLLGTEGWGRATLKGAQEKRGSASCTPMRPETHFRQYHHRASMLHPLAVRGISMSRQRVILATARVNRPVGRPAGQRCSPQPPYADQGVWTLTLLEAERTLCRRKQKMRRFVKDLHMFLEAPTLWGQTISSHLSTCRAFCDIPATASDRSTHREVLAQLVPPRRPVWGEYGCQKARR
jgi:hypothetical protein